MAMAGLITWGISGEAQAATLHAHGMAVMHLFDWHAWVGPAEPTPCASGTTHLAALGVLALLIVAALRFRHATAKQRLDLARLMVDKGMEPPADLLVPPGSHDLRRGLVLVTAGVGLLVYGFWTDPNAPSAAGLIPGFIGLGYLLSHRFAAHARKRPPS